ncbi:MAG: hypothetical protein AAF899_12895, partial [Pseudomonadota bacterium]
MSGVTPEKHRSDRAAVLRESADRLISAHRGQHHFQPEPGTGPRDEAEALVVQAMVAAALGPVGGFKTGRRSALDPPTVAPVLAADVVASGAAIDPAASRLRGVELEIAFRLECETPDTDDPAFDDRLADAVVALPALEIVESRLTDPEAAGPLWKRADAQINGGIVLGAPVADWRGLPLSSPTVRKAFDGRILVDGAVAAPGGCPFATFAAFARGLGTHCGGLRAGQVVITGSLTGLPFAPPGT